MALLAPCCVLIGATLLWALAALSALSPRDVRCFDKAAQILAVSGVLITVAHAAPNPVALMLTLMMAAHAGLIAVMRAIDAPLRAR
jgi:hypothetical protein